MAVPQDRPDAPHAQSVLDRLMNLPQWSWPPAEQGEPRSRSRARLEAALRRDLERLLNTRRVADPPADHLPEVRRSLYYYGLPDITSLSDSVADRDRLARHVQEAVELFEPRLSNVRVTPIQPDPDVLFRMRFSIEAMLRLDPAPVPVAFDTVLETISSEFEIEAERNG